jgi:hypothetical protein
VMEMDHRRVSRVKIKPLRSASAAQPLTASDPSEAATAARSPRGK